MGKLLGWKGRPCGRAVHIRGRRSVRSRQKPAAVKVDVISGERDTAKDIMEEAPGIFVKEEINMGEIKAAAGNTSSSERSGYEDDLYQATGDGYDYLVDNNDGYQGGFSGKSENIEGNDYNVDDEENEEIDANDNDDDDDEQVDPDVEDYIIGDSGTDTEENAEQNMDPNGADSTSSDYSD